jgi:hypothetical protein
MIAQQWIKGGLFIVPQKKIWWMQTHAMLPTVDHLGGDIYQCYFSGRDSENRSYIGNAKIKIDRGIKVLRYNTHPILTLGNLGCFDDNGVTPSWIISCGRKKYLYYIGWNKGSTVRMSLITGLAISTDSGRTYKRYSEAPLLDRTAKEPYSILTAPSVLREKGVWRMWYVSCFGWKHRDLPQYNIKYAQSKDGIHWERKGIVCIDFKSKTEHALARPCVLKENNVYKMWYSYKGKNYRLGYAESKNGTEWQRKDSLVGIKASKTGWDSKMIEYAFVFKHRGTKYMFYNGNEYGKTGIGYATLRE